MKKKLYAVVMSLSLGLFLLTACRQSVQELPSGVRYLIHQSFPDSTPIDTGSFVSFHLVVRTKDTVLHNSYDWSYGGPIIYRPILNPPPGSYQEVFFLLHKGDSASIWVKADSVIQQVGMSQMPPYLKPGSDIEYLVKILDVKTLQDFQQEAEQQQRQNRKQREAEERRQIHEYLKRQNLTADSTESGLYYFKSLTTQGEQAQTGDVVSVYYALQLLNKPDTLIESNKDAQPFEFTLGGGEVIKGWDEGIALFRKGEKGRLIVPSYMAYGAKGMGRAIPPHSILIFDIEVVDIRKPNRIRKQ